MEKSALIKTGIQGLDRIFLGGILEGNVILVEGAPGTGKTLLGMEFVYRGITQYNEPGIIVVFETNAKKLLRDAAGFGWNLDEQQQQNKLKVVFTSPQVLSEELRSPDSLLLEIAAEIGAKRIFIDSISLLGRGSNGVRDTQGNGAASSHYRELLSQLIQGVQRENLKTMLAHDCVDEAPDSRVVAEILADTVIALRRERNHRGVHRSLEITKSRGQDFDAGQHTLSITSGKGVEVFRRVQAERRDEERQSTSSAARSATGCEPLDALMGDGIIDGSITMVAGSSGVGKTILSMQLLLEGAKKQSKRGLLVSLDEHPAQTIRNAGTLGINLQEQLDAGMIHLLYDCPQELEVDIHFDLITRTIQKHNIERLVIDGMAAYSVCLEDERVFRDFIHALVSFCKRCLITAFFNCENPELFGMVTYNPRFGIGSIVDNIILLNFVELGDRMRRAITVAKTRASDSHFITREFEIGQGGISLLPVDETKTLPVLPFQSYYGLLSRAPTRYPNAQQGSHQEGHRGNNVAD